MSNKDCFHSTVLTREAGFCKCTLLIWLFFFTCLLYICFTLDKNGPRITYAACLIANSQNKKGQVFLKAFPIPRKQAASCRDADTIISLEQNFHLDEEVRFFSPRYR